ncbi:hypothetical protein MFRU_015g01700 [Monilinia fructicola]|uniref:Uncharacterized protein n=1 Tax=Monilinia fructicola TaxID=38448 RepID=A0A5M9K0B3_MONFR|nr:hypothetical protein EYC84_005824 [Monilinia fructicola]KAG4029634.1 hypothetical protein MFRU_015g01700 [Monilinia fructicola]
MSYSLAFDDTPQVLNIFSEWLCFSILWAGIKIYSFISRKTILHIRRSDVEEESTSLAFFIVTSSVCASIVQVDWILPFLTPALYFVTRNNSGEHYVLPSSVKFKRSEYPANYGYHLIFYILIAISTSLIFLPASTNPVTIGLALIFLICQTAIYSRLSSSPTLDEFQPAHHLFQHLEETCCWVVCFLTLILLVSQQPAPALPSFLIYSTFKALLWIAVVFLCNEGHACTLTLMSTYGLSTIYINTLPSPTLASLSCLCALLILAQIISTLPRNCSTRRIIALFAIFPLTAVLFRFGISESIKVIADMTNGLFPAPRCATHRNPIQLAPETPQAILDEPSQLIAEFGAREAPKSWLGLLWSLSRSCRDPSPLVVELR